MLARSPKRALHGITALPHDPMFVVCELLTDPYDQASLCLADALIGSH